MSEEQSDEGDDERVEGAGEESMGSLEETGWLSSSMKSSSSDLARLKTAAVRLFSCKETVQYLDNLALQYFTPYISLPVSR